MPMSPIYISIPEPFNTPCTVQDHFLESLAKQKVAEQLATYKKKMKEYFDKKTTDRQLSEGNTVFVFKPKLKTPKTKKKLQAKYHGPFIVVRFTNLAAVMLRNVASRCTLKKSINVNRLRVGYVKSHSLTRIKHTWQEHRTGLRRIGQNKLHLLLQNHKAVLNSPLKFPFASQ